MVNVPSIFVCYIQYHYLMSFGHRKCELFPSLVVCHFVPIDTQFMLNLGFTVPNLLKYRNNYFHHKLLSDFDY